MSKNTKYLHLQNLSTGCVFKLPENEAKEIFKSDRENYKITDKEFKDDLTPDVKTSVAQQVIEDDDPAKKVVKLKRKAEV